MLKKTSYNNRSAEAEMRIVEADGIHYSNAWQFYQDAIKYLDEDFSTKEEIQAYFSSAKNVTMTTEYANEKLSYIKNLHKGFNPPIITEKIDVTLFYDKWNCIEFVFLRDEKWYLIAWETSA